MSTPLPVTKPIEIPVARSTSRAWWAVVVLGLASVAGYFLVPADDQLVWYVATGAVSSLAIVLGVALYRPARPGGWYLLAAANACFAGGDATTEIYQAVTGRPVPSPS